MIHYFTKFLSYHGKFSYENNKKILHGRSKALRLGISQCFTSLPWTSQWFENFPRKNKVLEAVVRRCSVKKVFLKVFVKSFFKKRLQHRCCPMKFAEFSRKPILKNICERLLLIVLKLGTNTICWVKFTFKYHLSMK